MVALLGRNGMGKTTTIRSLCGLTPARRGSIRFPDKEIRGLPAFRIARLGLGLVPAGRRCFANLTVRENLVATARQGDGGGENRKSGGAGKSGPVRVKSGGVRI